MSDTVVLSFFFLSVFYDLNHQNKRNSNLSLKKIFFEFSKKRKKKYPRSEAAVQESVEKAVKMFGGIDIVINNATALSVTNGSDINVTGTQETSMKNFDLMHQVSQVLLSC